MKMRKTMFVFALVALTLVYGSIAQANVITGSLWHVSEAVSQNAIPGNVPLTTADVTFQVNSVNFDSRLLGTGYTVGGFLATSSAFNIVPHTAGILNSTLDPMIMQFTGKVTVTTGMLFTVTHDDGLTLIINGVDMGFGPGPSSPNVTTKTWTGAAGTYDFLLVYGECCGPPAVLQTSLPLSDVPEPATMLLLGTGLIGMAALRRKLAK